LREPEPRPSILANADIRRPESHSVAPALRRVEQQVESQARLGADRMACLELAKIFLRPRMKAARLDRVELDTERRIVAAQPLAHRKAEQQAQNAQEVALCRRLARLLREHRLDVSLLQERDALVAMPDAQRLKDVAVGRLRDRPVLGEPMTAV